MDITVKYIYNMVMKLRRFGLDPECLQYVIDGMADTTARNYRNAKKAQKLLGKPRKYGFSRPGHRK